MYKVGNPYQIEGVWYYPAEDFNYDETGIASWYGEQFHQQTTANGEVFDMNALTAAHRTLPLPSVVEVTNLDNGRTIHLRVNDRGPFARNRILDVSRRGAQLLGFEQTGTAKVHVRILVPETIQAASIAKLGGTDFPPAEVPHAAPREAVVAEALPAISARRAAPAAPAAVTPMSEPPQPVASHFPLPAPAESPRLPETVQVVPVKPARIFIQAGAFSVGDNATRLKSKLDALGNVVITGARVSVIDIYRVRLGPVNSVEEADQILARVIGAGATEAKIVVD